MASGHASSNVTNMLACTNMQWQAYRLAGKKMLILLHRLLATNLSPLGTMSALAYIYIAVASDHKFCEQCNIHFVKITMCGFILPQSIYSITVSDNSTMKVKWKILECVNYIPFMLCLLVFS